MASSLGNAWKKKNGGDFDNSMESLDGCEVCEYVGMYMLEKLKEEQSLAEVDIALYRDDLILATKSNSFQNNRVKAIITRFFADKALKMCDWHESVYMNYLDVTFDIVKKITIRIGRKMLKFIM